MVYINEPKKSYKRIEPCNAIILGSWRDIYEGSDGYTIYESLLLNAENNPYKKCNCCVEFDLTLINGDRDAGEQIIQSYLDCKSKKDFPNDSNQLKKISKF